MMKKNLLFVKMNFYSGGNGVHTRSFELSSIIKKDKIKGNTYIVDGYLTSTRNQYQWIIFFFTNILSHKFLGNNIIKLDRDFAFFLSLKTIFSIVWIKYFVIKLRKTQIIGTYFD